MAFVNNSVFFVSVVFASCSLAQIDPDPDGIGIYFDASATVVSADVSEEIGCVGAYLVLTNPSVNGALRYWQASVYTYYPNLSHAAVSGAVYYGQNLTINMPGSWGWVFEAFVHSQPPYPTSEVTLLAHLTFCPSTFNLPIFLYVSNAGGYSTWDGQGASMHPSSGSEDLPVAYINGPNPIATEARSWGDLKSLYR